MTINMEGNALVFPPKTVYIQGSEVLIKYMHALYTSRKSLICDLSGYGLVEWPEFVGIKSHTLEKVLLSNNKIPAIPSSMKVLTSLKTLDVSNNKLSALPVECAKSWRNLLHLEMKTNRYSVYVLYWYKSTKTDAAGQQPLCAPSRNRAAEKPLVSWLEAEPARILA